MAKILFIGDPHLKINRFELATKFLSWTNSVIEEKRPDIVVNLGDTFDTHAVLRSEVMNEFMDHVDYVNSLGIHYVYLLGNHDMFKPNDAKYHAMRPFKGRSPLLHVIDEPTEMFDMLFIPYQPNPNTFPKQLKPICVAHQTFFGADYGPVTAKDGVDPTSLTGCDIVISGHIHKRQILENTGATSIVYVGSPFSQSASDVGQVKGLTLFDTDTYEQEFIETPLPTWRRLHVVVSVDNPIKNVETMIEMFVQGSKDHWVLELEGPRPEIVSFLSSKKYKESIKDVDVKVKTTFTDKEKRKISIEAKSMDSIISDYVVKVYSGTIDKKELLEAAKVILSSAKQCQ